MRGHPAPNAKRRQRRARIAAGWDGIRVAGGELPFPKRCRKWKVRCDLELNRALRRTDEYQTITQEVLAAGGLDEVAALQVLHPLRVRGEEHVRRGAGFN